MKKLIIIMCLLACGCSPIYFQPVDPESDYRRQIKHWQNQIKQEGWSGPLVDNIIDGCLRVAKYEPEPAHHDHWQTYGEFQKTYHGDCEDIATFMYGTLKRLACPYGLKMRIIRMPAGDHAVLMVEQPSGWKMYNSVPMPGDFIDIALSRTVVEWDDQQIYYVKRVD